MNILPIIPYIFGIFGLIVGSFLNVVILRFDKKSIGGRSECPQCHKTLQWYELIPVVSFFIQKGKCRNCHKKISIQYPIVELVTGILFYISAISMINIFLPGEIVASILLAILLMITVCFVIIITVYDVKYQLIPNRWLIGLIITSILYLITWYVQQGYETSFIGQGVLFHGAGLVVVLPFLILWFISKGKWMGFGDILLIGWMGLFFGFWLGVSSVFLGIYLGGLFGIAFILVKRLQGVSYQSLRKTRIPFGPFLLAGWILTELLFIDIFSWFIF